MYKSNPRNYAILPLSISETIRRSLWPYLSLVEKTQETIPAQADSVDDQHPQI